MALITTCKKQDESDITVADQVLFSRTRSKGAGSLREVGKERTGSGILAVSGKNKKKFAT